MSERVVLITGSTDGIGKQTAIALAAQGARVVINGRSREKGERAVTEIRARSGNPNVELLLADLSTQAGVRRLAEQFKRAYSRLDVLINNAGLLSSERWLTEDGIEADFAVNVMAPFLLTHLLLDVLMSSAPARVVNVSGGIKGRIDPSNLQAEKSFRPLEHYTHTKYAAMAMAYEFAQRIADCGVTINVCFPGAASTPMTKGLAPDKMPPAFRLAWPVIRFLFIREDGGRTAARAARSSVYLATSGEIEGATGCYFTASGKPAALPADVRDEEVRRQLWALCERLTKNTDARSAQRIPRGATQPNNDGPVKPG